MSGGFLSGGAFVLIPKVTKDKVSWIATQLTEVQEQ